MAIAFTCDECGRSYHVRPELAGRSVRCKSCGEVLVVPRPGARTAASPAPRASVPQTASPFDDEAPLNLPRAGYAAPEEDSRLIPAPLTRRCLAFAIDRVLIVVLAIAATLAMVPRPSEILSGGEVQHRAVGALLVGYVLIYLAYLTLFHAFVGGATPGKMLFGIRVVDHYGDPIGPGRALRRALSQWVMGVTVVMWMRNVACLLSSPDTLTLYDETCGTAVILAD